MPGIDDYPGKTEITSLADAEFHASRSPAPGNQLFMADETESPVPTTPVADGGARRVLVTGGSSGLGLAMAAALAEAGAFVALTSRSGERAREPAASLPGAIGLELDVRDETSVTRAVAEAEARLGGIDMLVNNAGIGMRTVNPGFLSEPQGFWNVSRTASGPSSTPT